MEDGGGGGGGGGDGGGGSDSSSSFSGSSDSSSSDAGSSWSESGDVPSLFDRVQQPDVYTPTVDVNGPASRQRQEGLRRQLRQKGAEGLPYQYPAGIAPGEGLGTQMTLEESIREYNEALRKDRNRVWISCGLALATVVFLVVLVLLAAR